MLLPFPNLPTNHAISIIVVVDGFFKEFGETPWGHNEYRIISGKGKGKGEAS